MNYRQMLTDRLENTNSKTTLSEFYQEMESYETRCIIATATRVLIKNKKGK